MCLNFEVFKTEICVSFFNIFLILQQVLREFFERMRYNLELLGVCVEERKRWWWWYLKPEKEENLKR